MPTSMHNVGLICHHIFWRLSVSLSKSISIPNSCDRRWREELWEIYNFGSIVLMRFFCTMSIVVDSRPSFVSATTSCTVQVRKYVCLCKTHPLILFLNEIYAWYLNMPMCLCVCVTLLPSVFNVLVPSVLSVLVNATYSLCWSTDTNTTYSRFRREKLRVVILNFLGAEFNWAVCFLSCSVYEVWVIFLFRVSFSHLS